MNIDTSEYIYRNNTAEQDLAIARAEAYLAKRPMYTEGQKLVDVDLNEECVFVRFLETAKIRVSPYTGNVVIQDCIICDGINIKCGSDVLVTK
jgi:hypothetical protein